MTIPPLAREIYRDIVLGVLLIKAAVVDGEAFIDNVSKWSGIKKFIERQLGDRRHNMNVLELPTAVEDTVSLIKLIQADWAVVAPQNPALIAQAEKVKSDWEKFMGVEVAPVPPPAA